MSRDTSQFTIKEKELATALEITPERLDEIIDFFDSDPNDEWELRENDHFLYLNKTWKERIFSQHGAFAIAKYMDTIEEKSLWDRILEFVTKHKERLRNAFIRQKIYENSSSLTLRNNRHFLSKKDTVAILCTSYARLNQAFLDIKQSDMPMVLCQDFDDIEGSRYYSLSGFDRLSRELSVNLTNRDRREWCAAVEVVGKKTFKAIISEQAARQKRIQSAMDATKRRDGKRCQITGDKPTKHNKFNLAVHHVFSEKHYPNLATSMDNLITLREDVHKEFHAWNGGNQKACTIDDLIQFVNERYPESDRASMKLYQIKQMLGTYRVN